MGREDVGARIERGTLFGRTRQSIAEASEGEQRFDFPRSGPVVIGGLFDAHSKQLERTPGVAVEKRLSGGLGPVTRDRPEQGDEDPYGPTHVHADGPANASRTNAATIITKAIM